MAFDFSKGTVVTPPTVSTSSPNGTQTPVPQSGFASKWGGGTVVAPAQAPAPDQSKPGFLSRVSSDLATRQASGKEANDAYHSGDESFLRASTHGVGQAAGFIGDVGSEALKSVGNSIFAKDKSTGEVTTLSDRVSQALEAAGHTEAGQAIGTALADFQKNHPVASDYLGSIFNVASIIPAGKGAELAAEGAEDVVKAGAKKTVEKAASAREALSKGNRVPGLDVSAERIQKQALVPEEIRQGMSASNVKDPLSTYDEFSSQQDRALADTKADTAMGSVGSRIGNAYAKVIRMRRVAGETMGDEIKGAAGKVATKIGAANQNLYKTLLRDENLSYNFNTGKLTPTVRQVSMTAGDQSTIEEYLGNLKGLGPNPTAQELDAFIRRVPQELDLAKAAKGITKTTNGERIVKEHINKLKDELDAKIDPKTGIATKPELKKYSAAKKTYAQLSKFLEEGEGFLGKKTQSGDFAKDASLAKSAVQSLLNNGKKDWLMALEGHTGYPALDEAVLALQAMKDSGDFRGGSLLELLTEGAQQGRLPKIPTGATEMINNAAGHVLKAGYRGVIGTPREQTRRFLQSLKKK